MECRLFQPLCDELSLKKPIEKKKKPSPPAIPKVKPPKQIGSSEAPVTVSTPQLPNPTPFGMPPPEPPSLASKLQNLEKAYHSVYQTGASIISSISKENEALHNQVEIARHDKVKELIEIITELKYLQNAALQQSSDYYTAESILMTLREVNENEHEKMHKNLQDFKKEMADKIDKLLKLKTPCALTKVDMINTIRKEYQSFQDAQKVLESQRPIPVTATELKELAGSYSDLDKRIDRVEVMLNQRMDKMEETLESTKHQQNETLQSIKEAMETIQRTLLSSSSSSSSSTPANSSPKRTQAPSSDRGKTPPEVRVVSSVTRPQRDSSAIEQQTSSRRTTRDTESIHRPLLAALSNQELKEKISSLDRKIAAINKAMEDALRSTAEGSKRRHEQLRQEKTGLYKSKDFYEEQLRCRERNRSRSRSRSHGHCSRRQRTPSRSQHRGNGGHSSSRPSTSGWGV